MPRRKYYDLHLKPSSLEEIIEVSTMAWYLGYSGVGIDIGEILDEMDVENPLDKLNDLINKLEKELGVSILIKIDADKFKKGLKGINPLKSLTYRLTVDEKAFRKNLKDRKVHVITVPLEAIIDVLNLNTYNLLKQSRKALEITIKKLWVSTPVELQRILKPLYKATWLINKDNKDPQIYVSTGAEKMSEMRNPLAIRSYLRKIGLEDEATIRLTSTVPGNILKITKPIIVS